jgi:hypothetical protein
MMNPLTDAESQNFNWNWLYKVSGAAALILGLLFLAAIISLIAASLQHGTINAGLSLFQNNWLVVLFKLNAGFDGVQFDRLYGLNPLDIAILMLVAMMVLGLYPALRRTSRIWSLVAAVMPILGIILFIATKLAGRSGVMGTGLVISFVMLRSNIFGRLTAVLGILASLLLLAGDFGTTANSHSTIVAILVGIGYVLLMTWFFLVGRRLLQLGQSGSKEMQ